MPVAKVYIPEGALTRDQRCKIVEGIHEAIVAVRKAPIDAPTYVVINEVPTAKLGLQWQDIRAGKIAFPAGRQSGWVMPIKDATRQGMLP
jgi:phenylpyruvate tautomerase PptA (4-oxalocrotonate tautomerase family)